MAALTGQQVRNSYIDILQVSNSNSGIDATTRTVSDGEDTASKLQLSTTVVNVVSGFQLNGTAAQTSDKLKHEVGGIEADISAIANGGIVVGTASGTMAVLAGVLTDGATGFLAHEFGGIEADISAVTTDDFLIGTSSGVIAVRTVAQARTTLDSARVGASNTFTAAQRIEITATGAALTILTTDAGADSGPNFEIERNSASPANNDGLGGVILRGRDSGNNSTVFGNILGKALDVTDLSEDGEISISTMVAGTLAVRMFVQAGVQIGSPTGGDPGAGKINADDVQIGGASVLTSVNNGNWSGTDLAVGNGGTGSSTASGARTNLGLAIGSDVQADLDVPSQSEAEAGTATTERVWTAERVKQAIAALETAGVSAASQAEQETGTSTTVMVTPGRQHFHQSAAKMWAFVDRSAGTPSLSSPSYNVDSVSDVANAHSKVTIATDFSSAIYAPGAQGHANDVGTGVLNILAGSFDVRLLSTGGAALDTTDFSCWAFGDHA